MNDLATYIEEIETCAINIDEDLAWFQDGYRSVCSDWDFGGVSIAVDHKGLHCDTYALRRKDRYL